jgi:choline dehydrogenase-like flavoprotein
MVYMRPSASDYDDWETVYQNPGWGSKDLIPLLRKVCVERFSAHLGLRSKDHRSRRTRFMVGGRLTAQMDLLRSRQEALSPTSLSSSFKLRARYIPTLRTNQMMRT